MSASEPAPPLRILIADDHALVRRGLSDIIRTQSDMIVVAEAASGDETLALFGRHVPDVTLIDLRMPGLDGVQVVAAIKRQHPSARLIILTSYEGSEDMHRALEAGAQSYLLKSMKLEEVLAVIRAVGRGERFLPPAIVQALAERNSAESLSRREVEVLELVSKGLTNREIGSVLHITEGTVKLHVKSVLAKLGASDRTEAVTMANSRGIIHLE